MYHKKQKKLVEPTVLKVTVKKVEKPKIKIKKPSALYVRGMELLKQMKKEFPVLRCYKPLIIGISHFLHERYPNTPKRVINTALHIHTCNERYLTNLVKGIGRFDLDGNKQESVDEEASKKAEDQLMQLKQKIKNVRAGNKAASNIRIQNQ